MKLFYVFLLVAISCKVKTSPIHNNQEKFYQTGTGALEDNLQTVQFEYIQWACACANWVFVSDIEKYKDTGKLSEHTIFIEPADSSLQLPDTIGYHGDILIFTGQFYKEKGYPKKYLITEEPVEKARVFRYTKYSVIESHYRKYKNN